MQCKDDTKVLLVSYVQDEEQEHDVAKEEGQVHSHPDLHVDLPEEEGLEPLPEEQVRAGYDIM